MVERMLSSGQLSDVREEESEHSVLANAHSHTSLVEDIFEIDKAINGVEAVRMYKQSISSA